MYQLLVNAKKIQEAEKNGVNDVKPAPMVQEAIEVKPAPMVQEARLDIQARLEGKYFALWFRVVEIGGETLAAKIMKELAKRFPKSDEVLFSIAANEIMVVGPATGDDQVSNFDHWIVGCGFKKTTVEQFWTSGFRDRNFWLSEFKWLQARDDDSVRGQIILLASQE